MRRRPCLPRYPRASIDVFFFRRRILPRHAALQFPLRPPSTRLLTLDVTMRFASLLATHVVTPNPALLGWHSRQPLPPRARSPPVATRLGLRRTRVGDSSWRPRCRAQRGHDALLFWGADACLEAGAAASSWRAGGNGGGGVGGGGAPPRTSSKWTCWSAATVTSHGGASPAGLSHWCK